jgi:hypothetical protein
MNHKLLSFYFGALEEEQRLLVERELLTDSEILVDYLDLKRKLESAQEVPQVPSQKLWLQLREKLEPRKKMIFSLSLVAAIAASVLLFSIFVYKSKSADLGPSHRANEILFDSNRELPESSNVL